MSETLTVTVNEQAQEVPKTVETVSDFLTAVGFKADLESQTAADAYRVYRLDDCPTCGSDEQVELSSGMFVFDEGDEFVVVPQYVSGGG